MELESSVFHIAILFGAVLLLVVAAVNDAQRYRIPNWVCGAVVLLFPCFAFTAPAAIDWMQHLMIFGLVLAAGFAMFMGHIAGAGDIKLLAAVSLWAGPHYIALFLVITAIAGGALALVMAALTYVRNMSAAQAIAVARVPIPYGIAISTGGLGVLYMLSQPLLFPN